MILEKSLLDYKDTWKMPHLQSYVIYDLLEFTTSNNQNCPNFCKAYMSNINKMCERFMGCT